ncbi:MAG: signal peptidase II [Thermoanaerobaculia bacterium]
MKGRLPYLLLVIAVVALDLWTKRLVLANFMLHESREIIPDFFRLVYVQNTGAAFGLGSGAASPLVPLLLSGGAIAVFFIVVLYSFRTAISDRLLQTGLHLILGGAIGNLIDRFRFGWVVDFLDFYVTIGGREHHWPAFNVADSAISVGIGLLLLDMLRKPAKASEASRAS